MFFISNLGKNFKIIYNYLNYNLIKGLYVTIYIYILIITNIYIYIFLFVYIIYTNI